MRRNKCKIRSIIPCFKSSCKKDNNIYNFIYLKGPTGPTGPTGASGKDNYYELEVRSTTTIEPQNSASVKSTKQGNKVLLDFFIPKGEKGESDKVLAGTVSTIDYNQQANIKDRYNDGKHYMDFDIPCGCPGEKGEKGEKGGVGATGPKGEQGLKGDKGDKGEKGEQGIKGEKGEKGDIGPTGPIGATGPRGFPGEIGISEIITIDGTNTIEANEEAQVQDDKDGKVHHLTFFIPKGATGPKGEKGEQGIQGLQGEKGVKGDQGERGERGATGPEEIKGGMILSYNDDPLNFPVEGKEITSGARLPLMRLELDQGGVIELDNAENTIKFTQTGVYKITFSLNGYVKKTGANFDASTDFVSVAFREKQSEKILAAVTSWCYNECAINMYGQGLFVVDNVENVYELINTQTKSLFICGADLQKTISQSYFSVPMVSVVIFKLY